MGFNTLFSPKSKISSFCNVKCLQISFQYESRRSVNSYHNISRQHRERLGTLCDDGLEIQNALLLSDHRHGVLNRKIYHRQVLIGQHKKIRASSHHALEAKTLTNHDSVTTPGQKKDVSLPLPDTYNPLYVEAAWYHWWKEQGYFSPQSKTDGQAHYETHSRPGGQLVDDENFVICLPPPNVTGNLHLGHALTVAIQDALVRWHRMRGTRTLWMPGCDHAGSATQVVVEKKLWRDKKQSRFELGREEFVKEVWKWKNEKGDRIYHQMERLGASLDWSRACFTMDPKLSRAVTEAFIRLHDDGLIYRSHRLVNWSGQLRSAISDIEVEELPLEGRTMLQLPGCNKKVDFGTMTLFAYKLVAPPMNGDDEVVVATTRLETMLGDTAIAVNPDDARYRHLHGALVSHPICTERVLKIIADEFVDPNFGTGAVKITPAHDKNDYDVAMRHGLDMIDVLDDSGCINNVCPQYNGVHRFLARSDISDHLKSLGLHRGVVDNAMTLPICSRSGDVIEPRLKDQWYVRCSEMAERAIHAVQSGRLTLEPTNHVNVWFEWLSHIRDWCISRQLWWGHQIPAYHVTSVKYADEVDFWVSAASYEEAMSKAMKKSSLTREQLILKQDEDVLDTWFSSALFPFSSLGWPDKTPDMRSYYPTSVLVTGGDILFFWVARMVMLGERLTGQIPFERVLLHGVLQDAHGRKMSKSLGNVIDPMSVINGTTLQALHEQVDNRSLGQKEMEKVKQGQRRDYPNGIQACGADALRFTLCSYNFKNDFINMNINHVTSARHFGNKVWQAFRFYLSKVPPTFRSHSKFVQTRLSDCWILSRLAYLVGQCDEHFRANDLHLAAQAIQWFLHHEFCDVYVEVIKPRLGNVEVADVATSDDVADVRETLHLCLDTSLRCLHPFMPYLTEELYQRLPGERESLCLTEYPRPDKYSQLRDIGLEGTMNVVRQLVNKILSVKALFNINKHRPKVCVQCLDHRLERLGQVLPDLVTLSRSTAVTAIGGEVSPPDGWYNVNVCDGLTIYLDLKGIIDVEAEMEKLSVRLLKCSVDMEKVKKEMQSRMDRSREDENDNLLKKVPSSLKNHSKSFRKISSFPERRFFSVGVSSFPFNDAIQTEYFRCPVRIEIVGKRRKCTSSD